MRGAQADVKGLQVRWVSDATTLLQTASRAVFCRVALDAARSRRCYYIHTCSVSGDGACHVALRLLHCIRTRCSSSRSICYRSRVEVHVAQWPYDLPPPTHGLCDRAGRTEARQTAQAISCTSHLVGCSRPPSVLFSSFCLTHLRAHGRPGRRRCQRLPGADIIDAAAGCHWPGNIHLSPYSHTALGDDRCARYTNPPALRLVR